MHCQSRDRFVVKVRVSGFSAARIFMEHFVFKLPDNEVSDNLVILHRVSIIRADVF